MKVASRAWMVFGVRLSVLRPILTAHLPLAVAFLQLSPVSVVADGCFVVEWDKKTDITEPTEKAIIVFDGEREELLLQVKYEARSRSKAGLLTLPQDSWLFRLRPRRAVYP